MADKEEKARNPKAATPAERATPAKPAAKADAGEGGPGKAEVEEKLQEEQEAGGVGEFVDPTPNENYTVAGVTSGAPTPETDEEAAAEAAEATGTRTPGTAPEEEGA